MSDFNFKPIDCKRCGHLVWDGLTSGGIPMKLDMARLNIVDEIQTLLGGGRTYQIHRTTTSFEASLNGIMWSTVKSLLLQPGIEQ